MNLCLIPLGVVLVISVVASFFASKIESDFFLANRSVRWPMLIGTFVGLHVGGGFILGNTEASWSLGPMGAMYGLGLAFGMLLLGLGFGAKLRSLGVGTLPELLGQRFCSPLLQRLAGLLAIICLGGILMAQAIGLKKFLCSIGFPDDWVFFTTWGSVVLYTTCGGLLAVIWTDTIQALVMVGTLILTFCCAVIPHWQEIVTHVSCADMRWDGGTLSSLLFPLCYIFITQDIAQRCFAAKTSQDATKGCLLTALVLLVLTGIPTACGLVGRAMNLSPHEGAIFMQVVRALSSPFVFVMAASSVLLAIVSTASAVLLALSSNVTQDIRLGAQKGRLMTCLLGIGAAVGPYVGEDIISWLVTCNEIAIGAVFISMMAAVWTCKKTLPKEAAWGSFALGSLGTAIAQQFPTHVVCILAPLVLSGIGFVIGAVVARERASQPMLS
jgi:SSS family solute:Na+ symporter